jgi:hypothetical protein
MWRNNSLSIVFLILFALSLVGHGVSGWRHYNDEQRDHGEAEVTLGEFLRSAEFNETLFENWESEFLQMAAYVLLTVFLRQRGSAELKDVEKKEEVDEDPQKHHDDPDAPGPVRAGGWRLRIYKNSLGITFSALFIASFLLHAAAGARLFNQEAVQYRSADRVTTLQYMVSSSFWYESFQNWQSEFLSVLCIVILSIYLRQFGSPESKPVHAPHDETGR